MQISMQKCLSLTSSLLRSYIGLHSIFFQDCVLLSEANGLLIAHVAFISYTGQYLNVCPKHSAKHVFFYPRQICVFVYVVLIGLV